MNELPTLTTLKDINAYKKKLTWGDVPAIYHMASSSIGELDGILTHGFDSAYKQVLNKNLWNLDFLQAYKDKRGNIQVKNKPKIALKHFFDENSYELYCYPIVEDEKIAHTLLKHPLCPFENWTPESMSMLFRVKSLVSFITFSFKNGDIADLSLIKYAHIKVEELISHLRESFEIVSIEGYSILTFCQEIDCRSQDVRQHISDILSFK